MKTFRRLVGLPIGLLAVSLLTMGQACDPNAPSVVKINYEQLGACNGFQSPTGVVSVGPNAAYVAFRISTIENTGSNARDFNFDPNRLFINGSDPREFADSSLQLWGANPFSVQGRLVRAGTTETFNGAAVIVTRTGDSDGARETAQTNYTILYDTPAGSPGAFPVDTNPDRISWPHTPNCTSITF